MAKIAKPTNRKGTPPSLEEASNNLSNNVEVKPISEKKDLNFKVDADFKRRFKRYATDNDITMQALLKKAFAYYVDNNSHIEENEIAK